MSVRAERHPHAPAVVKEDISSHQLPRCRCCCSQLHAQLLGRAVVVQHGAPRLLPAQPPVRSGANTTPAVILAGVRSMPSAPFNLCTLGFHVPLNILCITTKVNIKTPLGPSSGPSHTVPGIHSVRIAVVYKIAGSGDLTNRGWLRAKLFNLHVF